MNEAAIQDAYKLFQGEGYSDSLEDFKNLIATNSDAFNDAYKLFQQDGYSDSSEDFAVLMGTSQVKKKEYPFEEDITELSSGLGSSDSQEPKPDLGPYEYASPFGGEIPEELKVSVPLSSGKADRFGKDLAEQKSAKYLTKVREIRQPFVDDANKKLSEERASIESIKDELALAKVDIEERFALYYDPATKGYNFPESAAGAKQAFSDEVNAILKKETEAKAKAEKYNEFLEESQRLFRKQMITNEALAEKGSAFGALMTGLTAEGIPSVLGGAAAFVGDMSDYFPFSGGGIPLSAMPEVRKVVSKERREKINELQEGLEKYLYDHVTLNVGGATKEFLNEKDTFWVGAMRGLGASIPAMLAAGVTGGGSFLAQAYDTADELAESVEGLSEDEKMAFKTSSAAIIGLLEKYGFRNVLSNKSLTSKVLGGVLTRMPKISAGKAGSEISKEFVDIVLDEGNAASRVLDAAKTRAVDYTGRVVGGAAAEFETGTLQSALGEQGLQQMTNYLKGDEIFDSVTLGEMASTAFYSGAQESVGGGFMTGAIAPFQKRKGATQEDFEKALPFIEVSNPEAVEGLLNIQVDKGNMTKDQARETYTSFKRYQEALQSLPSELSDKQKVEAIELIKQRNGLNQKLAKADEAFKPRIQEEVEKINDRLTAMAEAIDIKTEEDAVQEQVADEIPVRDEPQVSEEVEEQVSEAEPEVVAEKVEEEKVEEGETVTPKEEALSEEAKDLQEELIQEGLFAPPQDIPVAEEVVEEVAPVMEEPAPVVEDVVEEAAPVVEEAAPVVEEAAPVVEEAPVPPKKKSTAKKELETKVEATTKPSVKELQQQKDAETVAAARKKYNVPDGIEPTINERKGSAFNENDLFDEYEYELEDGSVRRITFKKNKNGTLAKKESSSQLFSPEGVLKGKIRPKVIPIFKEAFEKLGARKFINLYNKTIDPYYNKSRAEKGNWLYSIERNATIAPFTFAEETSARILYQGGKPKLDEFIKQAGLEGSQSVAEYNEFLKTVPINDQGLIEGEVVRVAEEAAPVAEEAAPVAKEVVDSKDAKKIASIEEEISDLESDVENSEGKIEELKEEIEIEKGNTKDGVAEFREKIKNEKNKEKKEELREELQDFKDEQSSLIDSYKEDISVEKSEASSARRKIANRKKKLSQLGIQPKVEPKVEETAPVAEEVIEEVAVEEVVEEVAEPKRGVLEDAEFENILRRTQLNPELLQEELDEFAEYERQIEELQDSPAELKKVKAKETKRKNAIKKARRGKIAEIAKEQEQIEIARKAKEEAARRKEAAEKRIKESKLKTEEKVKEEVVEEGGKRRKKNVRSLRLEINELKRLLPMQKEGSKGYNALKKNLALSQKELKELLAKEKVAEKGEKKVTKKEEKQKQSFQNRLSKIVDAKKVKEAQVTDLIQELTDAKQNYIDIRDISKSITKLKAAQNKVNAIQKRKDKLESEIRDLDKKMSELYKKMPRFRRAEVSAQDPVLESDIEGVVDRMNAMETVAIIENLDAVDPDEADTTIDAKELSERLGFDFPVATYDEIKDVPVIFNISDQLTSGDVVNPYTGNTITDLKGGLGIHAFPKHKDIAWASIDTSTVKASITDAKRTYLDNKNFFDNWWKENPKYDGMVPMVIVKMGESSILSNEAVLRVAADNLASLPATTKKRAASLMFKFLREDVKKLKAVLKGGVATEGKTKGEPLSKATIENYNTFIEKSLDVIKVMKDNNVKSIDEVLSADFISKVKDQGGIAAVERVTNALLSGSPNKPNEKSKKPGTAGKMVPKFIQGKNPSQEKKDITNLSTITDIITDPQMRNTPQRSAFMITGVNVRDGESGVVETEHTNYPVGPKGKLIGIVEKPRSIVNLFPSAYNNVVFAEGMEVLGKAQKKTDAERFTQVIPVQQGLGNRELVGTPALSLDERSRFFDLIQRSFPFVDISLDTEAFNNVINDPETRAYINNNEIVYGVTVDNDVFINPDVHKTDSALYNTSLHEMGHIWQQYLKVKNKGSKGRELYNKGVDLVQQTDEYQRQLEIFDGDSEMATDEAMAILIGNKGETIQQASLRKNFGSWLNRMWSYVMDTFGLSKDLTIDEIQDMTLDRFLGVALADIMSGKNIGATPNQQKKMKRPVMFSKSDPMDLVIQRGRESGYTESSIKKVLESMGYKSSDIDNSMGYNIDIFQSMPFGFDKVDGGYKNSVKLFNDVRSQLANYAKRTKATKADIVKKAQEILEANELFQQQTEQVQRELKIGLNDSLQTKANKQVQREIKNIKESLKERNIAINNLAQEQRKMRQFIRKNIVPTKSTPQSEINNLIKVVADTKTPEDFVAQSLKALDILEKRRVRSKKSLIKEIKALVSKKSKTASRDDKSARRRIRATNIDAQGQAFFKQAKDVLSVYLSEDKDKIDALSQEMRDMEVQAAALLKKEESGQERTSQEQKILDKVYAYDMFSGLDTMSLEDVKDLLKSLKDKRAESIVRLKENRAKRKLVYDQIKEEATEQIKATNPILFDERGEVLTKSELRQKRKAILQHFRNLDVPKMIGSMRDLYNLSSRTKAAKTLAQNIKHLGTISNKLDRTLAGKNVFRDNVYRKINKMEEVRHLYNQQARTDMDAIARQSGFKNYAEVKRKLYMGPLSLKMKNKTFILSGDQFLRLYALQKNKEQGDKLKKQGLGKEQLQQIKEQLGPDLIKFADGVVSYLSDSYYEKVNRVHVDINDVNLGYIPNYFPTQTEMSIEAAREIIGDGTDVFRTFDAQTSSALKERFDKTSDVIIDGTDFTMALDDHFESQNKFRAYARGVKEMNAFFKTPAVDMLLEETNLKSPIQKIINVGINPEAMTAMTQNNKYVNALFRNFVSAQLGYKIIQIPKQAVSFINAYEQYSYLPEDSKLPNIVKKSIDIPMFMVDVARTYASLPLDLVGKGPISEARRVSATFNQRFLDGLSGDVYRLEDNRIFKAMSQKDRTLMQEKLRRAPEAARAIGGYTTALGDVLGVMGYMVNYKRDIANGMSQADAVEKFNDYNATQQTRRITEKNLLQLDPSVIKRMFVTFGSVPFLYMNKVMSASTNIARSISMREFPRSKDTRALALNLSLSNMFFVLAANIFKLTKGDEEDREEVYEALMSAALGVNLLTQLPIIGGAVDELDLAQRVMAGIKGEEYKKKGFFRKGRVIDPLTRYVFDIKRDIKNETPAAQIIAKNIAKIGLGVQTDPFVGLSNFVQSNFSEEDRRSIQEADEDFYQIYGISKSYRPSEGDVEGGFISVPRSKNSVNKSSPEYQNVLDYQSEILDDMNDVLEYNE